MLLFYFISKCYEDISFVFYGGAGRASRLRAGAYPAFPPASVCGEERLDGEGRGFGQGGRPRARGGTGDAPDGLAQVMPPASAHRRSVSMSLVINL